MGDSVVVFSSFGFLIVVALLLNTAGVEVGVPTIPGQNPISIDASGNQVVTKNFIATVADCSINLLLDSTVVVPIITFIAGNNPFDQTARACNQHASSPLGDVLSNLVNGLSVSVTFLYQLVTFSLPGVPAILNLIIVLPPGLALVYIGFKMIRGTGG